MADTPLTILIAPDSFKGSLTSVQVARALADGWSRARPDDTILLCPLADGGEGTLAAVAAAGGWEWQEADATDPLGRSITARWLRSTDGARGVIEMAESSGLSRVAPGERDAVHATSSGLGDVLRTVAASGVREVILGIGGSATTDGGFGMLEALSMDYAPRADGAMARGIPETLTAVDLHDLDADLSNIRMSVACDVSNPLLGPTGAAAVYGPQKGATPDLVALLDGRLARFADLLEPRIGLADARPGRAGCRRGRRGRVRAARDPGPASRASHCGPAWISSWRRPTSTPAWPAPTSSSPARAASTPRPGSARRLWASPAVPRQPASRASPSAGASRSKASRRSRRSVPSRSRSRSTR